LGINTFGQLQSFKYLADMPSIPLDGAISRVVIQAKTFSVQVPPRTKDLEIVTVSMPAVACACTDQSAY